MNEMRHRLRLPADNPQRGAAATKRSRRNRCLGFRNAAVSRRAEKGDFVAHGRSCESDRRTNSAKAKCSNHALTCDFRADYRILCSKGRTVVTTLPAAREADTDKLSKLAV